MTVPIDRAHAHKHLPRALYDRSCDRSARISQLSLLLVAPERYRIFGASTERRDGGLQYLPKLL